MSLKTNDIIDESILNEDITQSMQLIKNWKLSNEKDKIKTFKSTTIEKDEYETIKNLIDTMRKEDIAFKDYKSAFMNFCKYCHTTHNGVIFRKIDLSKNKKDDNYTLIVEYADNTRKIKLPEGTKLYHKSKVDGIDKLIPQFRGKSERGYLYDKKRVYFTVVENFPKLLADYKITDKVYTYICLKDIKEVYIDPLVPLSVQGAVYVETESPIPVQKIEDYKKQHKESSVSESSIEDNVFFDNLFEFVQENGLILVEDDESESIVDRRSLLY